MYYFAASDVESV